MRIHDLQDLIKGDMQTDSERVLANILYEWLSPEAEPGESAKLKEKWLLRGEL